MKLTYWKKTVMVTAALVCILTLTHSAPSVRAGESWLISDGEAHGWLFLPEQAGSPVQFAAEELRSHLEEMTGVRIKSAWRARRHGDTGIILSVRDEAEWMGDESAQAFTIEQNGRFIEIRGNTETAVLYGVYQYLHELGVRWFSPGDSGRYLPDISEIAIADDGRHRHRPTYIERVMDFSGSYRTHFDDTLPAREQKKVIDEYSLWLIRNRLHFFRPIHRHHRFDFNRPVSPGSGHGLVRIVMADAELDQEPDRFPMLWRDGELVRTDQGPRQLCFSNETNIRVAAERVVELLEEKEASRDERNADLDEVMSAVGLGLADCRGICICPDCEEAGGEPPFNEDRLVWGFYNRVIERVNEEIPDGKIWLYAPYMSLHRPPEDVKINPNLAVYTARTDTWNAREENAPYEPFTKKYNDNVRATQAAGAEMRVRDYVLWSRHGATPQPPLNIFDAAEKYTEIGHRHYHVEVMQRTAQLWPVLWVLAHYTWDSDQDTHELLESYCHGSYGEAGGPVVLDLLREMDANSRRVHRIGYGNLFDTSKMMPDDFIDRGLRELADALEATSGNQLERLQQFADSLELFARQARFYRAYCRALNTRSAADVQEAKDMMDDFQAFWDRRNLSAISSPRILAPNESMMEALKNIGDARPAARDGLEDGDARLAELFAEGDAGPQMPEQRPENLFELPEIWKFRLDIEDTGLELGWHEPDHDDSAGWQPLSTWNIFLRQGYANVLSRFWYRLEFEAPEFPADKKVIMRIGSLDDEGEIYVNGQFVYEQDSPSDWNRSFAFDVTPYLNQGQTNVIAVRGFAAFGAGGLWRPSALYTE